MRKPLMLGLLGTLFLLAIGLAIFVAALRLAGGLVRILLEIVSFLLVLAALYFLVSLFI